MADKTLYTREEHALAALEAKASKARRLAHGADLRAYQDALADIGRAYLKAHPTRESAPKPIPSQEV
ncbi:hypothetical protein [Paucibacter soli]|uniref:hypothetical protein n=1 Tax=Paucibacter soli TaxID=3133433 RepID=UPI0030987CB3